MTTLMRRLGILGTVALALLMGGTAAAQTTQRDAPWRLTGISADQQTLKVVYQGSGCLPDDGRPLVDTSVDGRVSIRVIQSVTGGPYTACPLFLASYRLDVPLGAPLAGRFVVGGPAFDGTSRPRRIPRLIGLRRRDALRAARTQDFRVSASGARSGVVVAQSLKPGTQVQRTGFGPRLTLRVGPA